MSRTLFYDTETTGIPDFKARSEDPNQPRVTQICAELCGDESGEVFGHLNTLILPDGWLIPKEIEELTGITNEKVIAHGVPMLYALPAFVSLWKQADLRVGHNESFDARMIRIELYRHAAYGEAFADTFKVGNAFCTMSKSKGLIKLPPSEKMREKGNTNFKPPNLGEAYQHFTGKPLENAHNAASDVAACKAVYYGIRKAVVA